jgi:hypothetical protein
MEPLDLESILHQCGAMAGLKPEFILILVTNKLSIGGKH